MKSEKQVFSIRKSLIIAQLRAIKLWKKHQGTMWINRNQIIEKPVTEIKKIS